MTMGCRTLLPLAASTSDTVLLAPSPTTLIQVTQTPPATQTALPSVTPSATAVPTTTVSPLPSPLASPAPLAPLPSPTAAPQSADGFTVYLHPDGPLYVGDLVSLEIVPPPGVDMKGQQAQVQVETQTLGPVKFDPFGIGGRNQATFQWAWDTSSLTPGEHTLTFTITPLGATWTRQVSLLPRLDLPAELADAHWAKATNSCCVIHYITGTQAARDMPQLQKVIDAQAQDVSRKLGVEIKDPIQITLLPRVLGQGGFTSAQIAVSYLNRNYMGSDFAMVMHHELVHALDDRAGGDLRPTIFVEGLAVYLTGGHFKPEPLMPRAAALLPPEIGCEPVPPDAKTLSNPEGPPCGLGRFIPLRKLADNFYASQHEIGYLEGAALIEYMVKTWGWDAFNKFYRDIHKAPSGSQSDAIDAALNKHFGIGLNALESQFVAALRQEQLDPRWVTDVRLTTAYFDAARRYQLILDPSAYFMNAWLPDPSEMQRRGIVADYIRRPEAPENIAIETMLVGAGVALRTGDYTRLDEMLQAINAMLDVYDQRQTSR